MSMSIDDFLDSCIYDFIEETGDLGDNLKLCVHPKDFQTLKDHFHNRIMLPKPDKLVIYTHAFGEARFVLDHEVPEKTLEIISLVPFKAIHKRTYPITV